MDLPDIKELMQQMTLEEKIDMCSGVDFWHLKGIERLGIPSVMVSDGPHGLRKQAEKSDNLGLNDSIQAVCFPTAAGTASSFNRRLLRRLGETLGEECQAEHVAILLGPAVNIKRSPLCGRNFEYFSEDPYLAGEMAASYISGVQSKYVGTSMKHFAANNQERRRMTVSTVVDERTLREIYFPAFEAAVKKAQPWTVMCSYNRINGVYSSENAWLLDQVLRKDWGFQGFVMTDWGAANDRVEGIKAGLELEMPLTARWSVYWRLCSATQSTGTKKLCSTARQITKRRIRPRWRRWCCSKTRAPCRCGGIKKSPSSAALQRNRAIRAAVAHTSTLTM